MLVDMDDFNNDPWMTVKGLLILAIAAAAMLLMMASCSTTRYVEHVVEVHDTVEHVRTVTDSVRVMVATTDTFIQHDSIREVIRINDQGEVVSRDREAYFWREAWSRSIETTSQKSSEVDSLKSVIDRMQKDKEVVKQEPPSLMQRIKLGTWWPMIIIVLIESTLLYLIHYAAKKDR